MAIGANTRQAAYTGLDGSLQIAFFDYTVADTDEIQIRSGIVSVVLGHAGGREDAVCP